MLVCFLEVNMKNVLIVGGTSGLGLELALKFFGAGHRVVVTGRRNVRDKTFSFNVPSEGCKTIHAEYLNLAFTGDSIGRVIFTNFGQDGVDILVYAAGFYQECTMSELTETDIDEMLFVGLPSPALFLRYILKHQEKLPGFIAITSTSQWTPRLKEPIYNAVKGGLFMLASSVSLDERVGKVLVAAPAGMNTAFWRNKSREDFDFSTLLDPKWVAEKVI